MVIDVIGIIKCHTETLQPLYLVDSSNRSLVSPGNTRNKSPLEERGGSLCRSDNLKEAAEINSITYKLQKHVWVFLRVTSPLFPHTLPVVHAWVHLHRKSSLRPPQLPASSSAPCVLLSSLPFMRCLTSF